VSDHAEPVVPQGPHDLDLVVGDLAHAVRRVIRRARGLAAVAEAAKVGGDQREVPGKVWRDPMPHEVRLGDAVQQEDGWTLTAAASVNRRPRRGDVELFEAVEPDHGDPRR
jgi:hypothetical protein